MMIEIFALQSGFSGGIDLFLLFVVFLIVSIMLAFVLAYWVYTDAENRGNNNAALWAVVVGGFMITTFFGGLLALAVYIWQRD